MKLSKLQILTLLALSLTSFSASADSLKDTLENTVVGYVTDSVESLIGQPWDAVVNSGKHAFISTIPWIVNKSTIQLQASFNDGTDYQNLGSWNGDLSVNKLFGATDCGDSIFTDTSKVNSVMVGWRNLAAPNTNYIELSGFINRKPNDLFKDGLYYQFSALSIVPRNQAVSVSIQKTGDFYLFSAGLDRNLIMHNRCNSDQFKTARKISSWFGGQQSAPQRMKIQEQRVSFPTVSNVFPKTLRIADGDDAHQSCPSRDGMDPLTYLKNHPSGIYGQYQANCPGTLLVTPLENGDCTHVIHSSGVTYNNEGAAGYEYSIECKNP